jgi:hypothetical protein
MAPFSKMTDEALLIQGYLNSGKRLYFGSDATA